MARKVYDGKFNNKERSKQKLINAVGIVLKEKGYTGLTATNIANKAGLSRRLITTYFDSVDSLIETYVRNKDYWLEASADIGDVISKSEDTRQIIDFLLQNQLDFFYKNTEMQKLILWEISEKSKIMYKVCEDRERLGSEIFKLTDNDESIKNKNIDMRAISALLVAGIYYMVLHAKSTDTLFCEIDINEQKGMNRIKNALRFMVDKLYDAE